MRYVNVENVIDGMILAQDIKDSYGRVLLIQGASLSKNKVKKLESFDIFGVYIEDEWSADIFITPAVPEKLAKNTVEALQNMNLEQVQTCAGEIVDALLEAEDYMHDMESIKAYDENTFEHCVNVAVKSVTMGIGLGYNFYRLKNLAVGSMLHDIGKTGVAYDIINKAGKLTKEEFDEIKKHPTNGYNMLTNDTSIFASTRQIVYQHHENWDGTGYPRGLKGEDIYELAMIAHICDVCDALLSKRSYKNAFSIADVIRIMQEGTDKMFSPELLDAFFRYVPLYCKGSEVLLSNQEKALVYRNNRGNMLAPIVKLRNGTLIDLRESSLTILQ